MAVDPATAAPPTNYKSPTDSNPPNYKPSDSPGYSNQGQDQGGKTPNDFGQNTKDVKMTTEGNRHDEATTKEANAAKAQDDKAKNDAGKLELDKTKEADKHEEKMLELENKAKIDNKKEDNHHMEAKDSLDMQYKNTKGHQKFG
jgi:hypothetical protein